MESSALSNQIITNSQNTERAKNLLMQFNVSCDSALKGAFSADDIIFEHNMLYVGFDVNDTHSREEQQAILAKVEASAVWPFAIETPGRQYIGYDLLNERTCDYMLYRLRKKLMASSMQVPEAAAEAVTGGIREQCRTNEKAYWQAALEAKEFEPGNKSFVLAAIACQQQAEMCR